jgi:hypothetical protein
LEQRQTEENLAKLRLEAAHRRSLSVEASRRQQSTTTYRFDFGRKAHVQTTPVLAPRLVDVNSIKYAS